MMTKVDAIKALALHDFPGTRISAWLTDSGATV